jgi:hypothetical protein
MNTLIALAALALMSPSQDPKALLKKALKEENLPASWIYDDLDKGFAEAKKSGKPMLVVFR